MTAASSPPWFDQVKAWPVADLAARFGLEVARHGADVSFPCPVCRKERRHTKGSDPRLPAKAMRDGWWCEPCGAGGDAVRYAAALVTGSPRPPRERWAEVRKACEDLGLCVGVGRLPPLRPMTPAAPQRPYPPTADLTAFWHACSSVTEDSRPGVYLAARGFDLEQLAWLHMVRMAPRPPSPTPAWWPAGWLAGWPLVFPAYDGAGNLRSLHARSTNPGVEPKTRWPYKCNASGLLFADGVGLDFLRGCNVDGALEGLEGIVIAEGATDTLKLAQVLERSETTMGVLGYVAGSKHALARIDWPSELPCLVATDDDATGDRYAAEIRQALRWRVPVFRVRAPPGRNRDGQKGGDWCDLTDGDVADALADSNRWVVCRGG